MLSPQVNSIVEKVLEFEKNINENFIGRSREIRVILLALIAEQHAVLVGKAGTAKSAIANVMFENIEDASTFNRQLTPYSTPEELFGAYDVLKLREGVYERNINKMLPTVEFGVLDEIFKANSSILNSLLSILQERTFDNGTAKLQTPLKTVVGLSNEYPEDDSLEALFDRFILRCEVDYLKDNDDFATMLMSGQTYINPIHLSDIEQLHFVRDGITITEAIISALVNIRTELITRGIQVSDRRYKHSLNILKAQALLRGSDVVENQDLIVLADCLWKDIEEREAVEEVVSLYTSDPIEKTLTDILVNAEDFFNVEMSKRRADKNSADLELRVGIKAMKEEADSVKERFANMWEDRYEQMLAETHKKLDGYLQTVISSDLKSFGF